MATIHVVFSTYEVPMPAGTVAGLMRFSLNGPFPQIVEVALPTSSVDFTGVPPGSYTVTAQRLDSAGFPIGSPNSSAPIVIAEPEVMVAVPASLGISQS